jgi:two-component system OmpR family response regulator
MGEKAARPTVLLVDDDGGLLDVLAMALEDEGFAVSCARDGTEGLAAFERVRPDLVVLDVLMPELDGIEVCRRIRATHRTPIIMLTSRDQEVDKVLGLEMGADDYVTKPFSTRELSARIRAALRRVDLDRSPPAGETRRDRGLLALDRARREVRVGGALVTLTATEFDLLWTLAGEPGRVFTRDALMDAVYGEGIVVAHRTIDTFVKRIRQKLGVEGFPAEAIETVRGVGYRLRDDEPGE